MRFLLILLFIALSSCASYYDDYHDLELKKYFTFKFNDESNTYTALERIPSRAGTERYYPQKFLINLPKKIKGFVIYGNDHLFGYDSRQIISVNAGYSNKNSRPDEWKLEVPTENDLSGIKHYYKKKAYSERIFDYPNDKRKTVMYTNGEVKIILFNIKPDKFDEILAKVRSFKYLP